MIFARLCFLCVLPVLVLSGCADSAAPTGNETKTATAPPSGSAAKTEELPPPTPGIPDPAIGTKDAATTDGANVNEPPAIAKDSEQPASEPSVNEQITNKEEEVVPPETPEAEVPQPELAIGSPAPPLSIAGWAKGEAVDGFKPGEVYVVEFWATWCGPCLAGMPHVSELQKQFGDKVRIIGVTAEDAETVSEFLKEEQSEGKTWDEVVEYTLALDDSRKTNTAYMDAAGRNGIPCAFVVGKEGLIEWIGHPMGGLDNTLAKVVDGTWDREAAIAAIEEEKNVQRAMMRAQPKLQKAVESEDWDAAIAAVDDLMTQFPNYKPLHLMKFQMLKNAERKEEGEVVAAKAVEVYWDEPQLLNQIAWVIAAEGFPGKLDDALKAARRATELTKDQDAAILDTLARVHFEKGEIDEAIASQKKAVTANSEAEELADTLKKYEDAKTNGGKPASESGNENVAPPAADTPEAEPVDSPAETPSP